MDTADGMLRQADEPEFLEADSFLDLIQKGVAVFPTVPAIGGLSAKALRINCAEEDITYHDKPLTDAGARVFCSVLPFAASVKFRGLRRLSRTPARS